MAGQVPHWQSACISTGTARSRTITTSSSSLWYPSVTQPRDVAPLGEHTWSHTVSWEADQSRDLANHHISLSHSSPPPPLFGS